MEIVFPAARRLLVCAAIFHLSLAVALFVAGRLHVAPSLIGPDGQIARVGADTYGYQQQANALLATLRSKGAAAWLHNPAAFHIRIISLLFLMFGSSTLAAEPLNLVCYLIVIALVLAITREVGGGPRESLAAAAVVALWPTFLLHTLQLLKDPLFVAGALALVLVVLTLLTRTYDWRGAGALGAGLLVVIGALLIVRPNFTVILAALLGAALVLLIVRQAIERRCLVPNVAVAVAMLAFIGALMALPPRAYEKRKIYPSPDAGEPKQAAATGVPTKLVRTVRAHGAWAAVDRVAFLAGLKRSRYEDFDSEAGAGSGVDGHASFQNARELAAYLPRAAAIGLWAPFPASWFAPGRAVGSSGRLLAGAETAAIYLCQILAIIAVVRLPRRLPVLLMLIVVAVGVTAEAVVVSNVGSLYRLRYSFWMLLVILGVLGLASLRSRIRPALVVAAALLFVSCGPRGGLTISNILGNHIRGLYLSPHDAKTWQENVLGNDAVADGEAVVLRIPDGARNVRWDLRIDRGHRQPAVWSGIDLSKVSTLELHVERGTVVAEAICAD